MNNIEKVQSNAMDKSSKRGRGRPRKHPVKEPFSISLRGRGRPRKYEIIEKKRAIDGEVLHQELKKVDSAYLMDKMLNYFTKLLVLHSQLGKESGRAQPVFDRLKSLDFQMIEICKTVLSKDFEAK